MYRRSLFIAAAVALLALALLLGCYQSNTVDLPWHLKTGEWIVAHRAVPATDVFCFTRAGLAWLDSQWLFQVVLYGFTAALGEPGVTVFIMLGAAAMLFLTTWATPEATPGARALGGFLFLVAIDPRLLPRPETVSLLGLAALIFIFERARRGRTRWLGLVFPVSLCWSNSEGLWPIAVFVAGAYAAEAWWEGRSGGKRLWPWLCACGAAVLAGLLQPYGWRGFMFPLTLLFEVAHPGSLHKQMVAEFQPLLSPPFLPGEALPVIVLAAATLVAIALAGRRVRPAPLVLAAVFFGLALSARRNLGLAAVTLAPAFITHLEIAARRWPRLGGDRAQATMGIAAIAGAAALITVCLVWPTRAWDHSYRDLGFGLSPRFYPTTAAHFLKKNNYRGRIINDMAIGGYLIYAGWPEWQVSADPRLEIGGEEWLAWATDVFIDPEKFRRLEKESGAEAVVIFHYWPYMRVFALRLVKDPGWALVFVDQKSAVFLKRNDRNRAVIEANLVDLDELMRKRENRNPERGVSP